MANAAANNPPHSLLILLPQLILATSCTGSLSLFSVHPVLTAQPSDDLDQTSTTLRIRLLPQAIRYLNSIAADLIAEQLPRLRIRQIIEHVTNDRGIIRLSNVRISRFKRATLHTITTSAPNTVTWSINNFNIGLIGDLSGNVNVVMPLKLEGKAEVQAHGVNFRLESELKRSETGSARVHTLSCRTTIRMVVLENYNGGLAEIALNLFKKAISEHMRPIIQVLICKKMTQFINEDLNEKLSQTQTKTTLADAVKINSFGVLVDFQTAEQFQNIFKPVNIATSYPSFQKLANRVFIDFRLSEDPVCGTNMAEIGNLGKISLEGVNRTTPFGIPPLLWPPRSANNSNAMIQILISDYIANALLYQAFEERLLQLIVDDDSVPSLSSFLRTSCSTTACIADLLPQIGKKYPNSKVKIVFTPSRAPAVIFQKKRDGLVTVNVNGLVLMYANVENSTSRQAAAFELDAVASNHFHISNNTLLGGVTIDRFRLKNKYKTIEISDDELSDIALLSSEMLQSYMNNFLRVGFPIPIPKVLRLKADQLRVHDRSIFISSEFTLDRRRVSDLALQAFAETHFYQMVSGEAKTINTTDLS